MKTDKENEWREEFEKYMKQYFSTVLISRNTEGIYERKWVQERFDMWIEACRARKSEIDKKDQDYFLIRDHNKKLCEQITSLKAELEKARELIKESKYLIDGYSSDTPLYGVVDCCNNYNLKAKEFLKTKEGESHE